MGGKGKIDDELAHAEYWDERYKTSVSELPVSHSSSFISQEGSDNETGDEDEDGSKDREVVLDTYDWFRSWEHLESWCKENLPPSSTRPRILHLGCGNSTLTADLYDLGFTDQVNIDFSEVVIKGMEAKYSYLGAEWKVMDVRQMDFSNGSFEIAIDKATMDSMFHGSMWDPPEDVRDNINKYLDEVDRVLVPGGTFLYITYRQPHFIRPLLLRENIWTVDVRNLPDQLGGVFEYFAYVMEKHSVHREESLSHNDKFWRDPESRELCEV